MVEAKNKNNIEELIKQFNNKLVDIDELLEFCSENGCSDLYIKAGTKPHINKFGKMYQLPCMPINDVMWNKFAKVAISQENNKKYVREKMLDFSYSVDIPEYSRFYEEYSLFRYRVSAGFSQGRFMATFRMITPYPPTFESIDFPKVSENAIRHAFKSSTGIVLLCGPTGSGKTTTLASSINDFTKNGEPLSNSMLITLEDPIEYIYDMTDSARIIQKELGSDFKTFSNGVKQALREHPTHILCGEIRDSEGINVCVEASRTGHKVVTTFHTEDVAGSVSRMLFYLSKDSNVNEAVFDLITNLSFIMCQRLVPSEDGFKLETQYMLFIDKIKDLLQKAILRGDNITMVINDLFNNEQLISNNIVKNWS